MSKDCENLDKIHSQKTLLKPANDTSSALSVQATSHQKTEGDIDSLEALQIQHLK